MSGLVHCDMSYGQVEKGLMKELTRQYEQKRLSLVQPLLETAFDNQDRLPYVRIFYFDAQTGSEMKISAVCISVLPKSSLFNQEALVCNFSPFLSKLVLK